MDITTQIEALQRAKQRRLQALKMHQQKKSLREIGEALNVSRERARQLVAAAIRDTGG